MPGLKVAPAQSYTRPEDQLASRWLDRAIGHASHPIKGIAQAIGRDEKTLHKMRRGLYRVGLADLVRLPADVRREIVAELARACGLAIYEPVETTESLVNTIQKLLSESGAAVGPLLEHGQRGGFERKDSPTVRKHARRIAELARALERYCDTADVDGYVRLPDE